MFKRLLIALLFFLSAYVTYAQNADLLIRQAAGKYQYIDINNMQWFEQASKKQLLLPVKLNDTIDNWILYNASTKQPAVADTFNFIFDYSLSENLSGILYRKSASSQQLYYTCWNGLPGQGIPKTIELDVIHQNRFVKEYLGITEKGKPAPVYLHLSGNMEPLLSNLDSAALREWHGPTFQVATIATGESVLLVDKKVHATYSSIQWINDDNLLLKRNNQYWFLRYNGTRLDSAGPFLYTDLLTSGKKYFVVKQEKGEFAAFSLSNFSVIPIHLEKDEKADSLLYLNGSSQWLCRYTSPKIEWVLLEEKKNNLERTMTDVFINPQFAVRPVHGYSALIETAPGKTIFKADIRSKSESGTINNLIFNSIQISDYTYEITSKKHHIKRHIHVLVAQDLTNKKNKVAYFNTEDTVTRMFESLEPELLSYSFTNPRIILMKNRDGWNAKDLQTNLIIKPATNNRFVWITDFISPDISKPIYYSYALQKNNKGEEELLLLDNGSAPVIKSIPMLKKQRKP